MEILYATNDAQVHRHSSIGQFKDGFLSTWKKGGWAPIVFDQLDYINCEGIHSHPVIIDMTGESLGYIFPEAKCTYSSNKFIYFDKEGVEQRILPACFGKGGEFYDAWVRSNAFVNFDGDSSVGVHEKTTLRVGMSYCLADETLPAVN